MWEAVLEEPEHSRRSSADSWSVGRKAVGARRLLPHWEEEAGNAGGGESSIVSREHLWGAGLSVRWRGCQAQLWYSLCGV